MSHRRQTLSVVTDKLLQYIAQGNTLRKIALRAPYLASKDRGPVNHGQLERAAKPGAYDWIAPQL